MTHVSPAQVGKALDAALLRVKLAVTNTSTDPVFTAAKRAAGTVRLAAMRSSAPVAIRVTRHSGGVRITVTGPGAKRVRALLGQELDRLLPEAADRIKANITQDLQ